MAVFGIQWKIARHFERSFGKKNNMSPLESDLLNSIPMPIQFKFRQICDWRKGDHYQVSTS